VLLALSVAVAKKLAQKSKEPPSADAGLCVTMAMSFKTVIITHVQRNTFCSVSF